MFQKIITYWNILKIGVAIIDLLITALVKLTGVNVKRAKQRVEGYARDLHAVLSAQNAKVGGNGIVIFVEGGLAALKEKAGIKP